MKSLQWALPLLVVSALASAQTVTDDSGNKIELSQPVLHIADAWFAHHSLLMTLGAGDRIVATVNHPADRPWMFKVQPSLNQALQAHGKTFNSEALVARNVDAIFVPANDPDAESYRLAGIPVLAMNFDDFDSMKRSLTTTAQVVGHRQRPREPGLIIAIWIRKSLLFRPKRPRLRRVNARACCIFSRCIR